MSKIEVDAIEPQSGTTLTIGASGDTVNIASGATITDFTSTGIDDNATSTAITIDSSENIGINTTTIPEVLTVNKSSNGAITGLSINNDYPTTSTASSGTGSGIRFGVNDGTFNSAFGDARGSEILSVTTSSNGRSRDIVFKTDSGGTLGEVMRITSSGNVGIGTTSTTGDGLTIYGSTNEYVLTLQNPNVTTGFRFYMGESGYSHQVLRLYDNSNRALVNFDGEMGLTSFGPVQGEVDAGEQGVSIRGAVGQIRVGINSTGLNTVFGFFNPNGEVGTIRTTGSSTQFNTSSDYRLKENVSYDFDATTRLKQLKPARFNFIADADTTVDGFLAHEVSDIVPEAISGEKDAVQVWKEHEELPEGVSVGDNKLDENGNTIPDYQGIDQSKLVPLLVKTIQELEARITALETTN